MKPAFPGQAGPRAPVELPLEWHRYSRPNDCTTWELVAPGGPAMVVIKRNVGEPYYLFRIGVDDQHSSAALTLGAAAWMIANRIGISLPEPEE